MSDRVQKILFIISAALLAGGFFVLYAFLPLTGPRIAASPDENANAYFTREFATTGKLWQEDVRNLSVSEMVHPRSTRVIGGVVVPGSFLGLPVIFGSIATLLGTAVIPYLTPFFALLAVAAWLGLIAHFFGKKIGLIAALLLAVQPVWWYETARTLAPNVFFVSLALIGAWFFFTEPMGHLRGGKVQRVVDAILAGIFFGLALAVRMSEAYWFVIGGIVLLARAFPRIPWKRALVVAASAALTLAPFLLLNRSIYGSFFATGYGASIDLPSAITAHGRGAALLGPFAKYFFPLGFAPRSAVRHFMTYGVTFFWWWSMLVGAACIALGVTMRRMYLAKTRIARPVLTFCAVAVAVAVWLVLFYGSWTVQDNSNPLAVTIGSSYLRYWLPIFIFSTVPVAWLIADATDVMTPRKRKIFFGVFAILFVLSSASDVLFSPQEGLLPLRQTLFADEAAAKIIFANTEPDAIIVVDRADKFLFPSRRVVVPLRSDATYAALPALIDQSPLYYFGITFPESDLRWLREVKLSALDLTIDPVLQIDTQTLYRFTRHQKP